MASDELSFQNEILSAARETGGNAFKLSNRFLAGIPDLYIKLPNFSSTFIECKWVKLSRYTKIVPIKLTKAQKAFIMKEKEAGGNAGVLIGSKWGVDFYAFPVLDIRPSIPIIEFWSDCIVRKRGSKWNIKEILTRLKQPTY